jgi:EAL domain-containing protein (putative c-di-GMP-specific phosphodiesterase class I)
MDMKAGCQGCRTSEPLPFTFTMAFHPIVDVSREAVWGYEALVRGTEGQSAYSILNQVDERQQYRFDQACRVKAIELAGRLFPRDGDARLSVNFMPNAVYEPAACIRTSLETARRVGFDTKRIMFEFTENERFADTGHVARIVAEYRRLGFVTAIDDFGAGHAGLNLLASFQPDILKIDMELIRGIADSAARRAIVAGIMVMARALDITVVAEGVETHAELAALQGAGITLFQGYLFAKPALEHLPEVAFAA